MEDQNETQEQPIHWFDLLDERTRKHVKFARHYAAYYAHGAPGHMDLMTIATLASFLDTLQGAHGGEQSPDFSV